MRMDWNVLMVGKGNSTFLIPVKFECVILFVVLLAHPASTPIKEDIIAKSTLLLVKYCGGKTRLGETNVCNPDEAYCLDTRFCLVSDVLGDCAAYLGECSSAQDCDDLNNQYCDKVEGKCKERLEEDACCFEGVDQCGPGLECIGDGDFIPFQCKPAVQSGVCNNQFCGGIAAFECDCLCKDGQAPVCVDDPNDGCDPAKGGADCGGICQCKQK